MAHPATSQALVSAKKHLDAIDAIVKSASPAAAACLAPLVAILHNNHSAHFLSQSFGSPVKSDTNEPNPTTALIDEVLEALVPVAKALAAQGQAVSNGAAPSAPAVPTKSERGFTDDEILCSTQSPVSFVSPRGKFMVHCLRSKFALENTSPKGTTTYLIEHKHVRKVLALERGDSNDTKDVMIALDGTAALQVGKQSVKTLLAQVRGKDKPIEVVKRLEMGLDERLEGDGSRDAGQALTAFLELATGTKKASKPKLTGASGFAGVANRGCVKANVKFNQGFLFCVPDGFAFVDRPSLWLPFDDIGDLQLARAEGVGSSFDLMVSTEAGAGGDSYEFGNISREELDGVRRYLAKNCAEAKDEGEPGTADAMDDDEEDDDESDEDDEDFGVEENESESDGEESDDDDEDGDEGDVVEEESDAEEESDGSDGDDLKVTSQKVGEKRKAGGKPDDDAIPGTGVVAEGEEESDEDEDSDEDGAFGVVAAR